MKNSKLTIYLSDFNRHRNVINRRKNPRKKIILLRDKNTIGVIPTCLKYRRIKESGLKSQSICEEIEYKKYLPLNAKFQKPFQKKIFIPICLLNEKK